MSIEVLKLGPSSLFKPVYRSLTIFVGIINFCRETLRAFAAVPVLIPAETIGTSNAAVVCILNPKVVAAA